MAHFLLLISEQQESLTTHMAQEAKNVLEANNHTYYEIFVPSCKQMPSALNFFTESLEYSGLICIGIMEESNLENTQIHYSEIIGMFYDFISYYGYAVAIVIANKIGTANELGEYARTNTLEVCKIIEASSDINSFENRSYDSRRKHN